jgi:hypothetical protein
MAVAESVAVAELFRGVVAVEKLFCIAMEWIKERD